jgi:hypothetical protein
MTPVPPFALSVSPFRQERADDNAKSGTRLVEARSAYRVCSLTTGYWVGGWATIQS